MDGQRVEQLWKDAQVQLAIKRAARAVQPSPYRLDNKGNTRDDYESILRAHAWEVLVKLDKSGELYQWSEGKVRNHTYVSIWNRARDCMRRVKRNVAALGISAEYDDTCQPCESTLDSLVDAVGIVDTLHRNLSAENAAVLDTHVLREVEVVDLPTALPDMGSATYHAAWGRVRTFRKAAARVLTLGGWNLAALHIQRKSKAKELPVEDVPATEENNMPQADTVTPEMPQCFGLAWDAAGPGSPCEKCLIQGRCLDQFVRVTLPIVRVNTQGKAKPIIAATAGISVEALELAEKYEVTLNLPIVTAEGALEALVSPPVLFAAQADPAIAGLGVAPVTPDKVVAAPKKAKALKGAVKCPPSVAGSAIAAVDPATLPLHLTTAPIALEQDGAERVRRGGRKLRKAEFRRRRREEKRRLPWAGALVPGTRITRVWKGNRFVVEVVDAGYLFNYKLYPSLYQVMLAIVGRENLKDVPYWPNADGTRRPGTRKAPPMSAARFFNLNRLAAEAAKVVQQQIEALTSAGNCG